MKTDKLLQLIQQKKVMRSGGALPLPKAQKGVLVSSPPRCDVGYIWDSENQQCIPFSAAVRPFPKFDKEKFKQDALFGKPHIIQLKDDTLESKINESLGDPMGKAISKAEEVVSGEEDVIDNYRHPLAGMYTAQGIMNLFPKWMQYTGIPQTAGFLGSTGLGIGHELQSNAITQPDKYPPGYTLWDVIREGGEDAFNNMVGAGVGITPFASDKQKEDFLLNAAYNNYLPDGYGKGDMYFKKQGGSLPKAQQGIIDYYFNTPKKSVKKEVQTGGCPTGWIKDPVTKKCIRDTSNIPKVNPEAEDNLDQYLYLTNQLTPIERIKFEVVRSLKKIRGNDPTAPKTPLIEEIRQTGGQEGILPKAQVGKPIYVTDPNDPRLKAYSDSLSLYNNYMNLKNTIIKGGKFYPNFESSKPLNKTKTDKFNIPNPNNPLIYKQVLPDFGYNIIGKTGLPDITIIQKKSIQPISTQTFTRKESKYKSEAEFDKAAKEIKDFNEKQGEANWIGYEIQEYKEPVQPIKLKKYWTKKDVDATYWDNFIKKYPDAIGIDPNKVDANGNHIPVYDSTPSSDKEVKREEIEPITRKFDFGDDELRDVQPIAPTPYIPDPVRRVMNPNFQESDYTDKHNSIVDPLGNPRYKYYNEDKVISESEYNRLMQKREGGSLSRAQLGGSPLQQQLINQALGQNNSNGVRSSVTVAPRNLQAQAAVKDIATYGSIEKAAQAKAIKKSIVNQKESVISAPKAGYGNYEFYNPAQGEYRDDKTVAPQGSLMASIQNDLNAYNQFVSNQTSMLQNYSLGPARGVGAIAALGSDFLINGPVQSAINIANTFVGNRPLRGDEDFVGLIGDAFNAMPVFSSMFKGAKSFNKASKLASEATFSPTMGIMPGAMQEGLESSSRFLNQTPVTIQGGIKKGADDLIAGNLFDEGILRMDEADMPVTDIMLGHAPIPANMTGVKFVKDALDSDPVLRREIAEIVRDLNKDYGLTLDFKTIDSMEELQKIKESAIDFLRSSDPRAVNARTLFTEKLAQQEALEVRTDINKRHIKLDQLNKKGREIQKQIQGLSPGDPKISALATELNNIQSEIRNAASNKTEIFFPSGLKYQSETNMGSRGPTARVKLYSTKPGIDASMSISGKEPGVFDHFYFISGDLNYSQIELNRLRALPNPDQTDLNKIAYLEKKITESLISSGEMFKVATQNAPKGVYVTEPNMSSDSYGMLWGMGKTTANKKTPYKLLTPYEFSQRQSLLDSYNYKLHAGAENNLRNALATGNPSLAPLVLPYETPNTLGYTRGIGKRALNPNAIPFGTLHGTYLQSVDDVALAVNAQNNVLETANKTFEYQLANGRINQEFHDANIVKWFEDPLDINNSNLTTTAPKLTGNELFHPDPVIRKRFAPAQVPDDTHLMSPLFRDRVTGGFSWEGSSSNGTALPYKYLGISPGDYANFNNTASPIYFHQPIPTFVKEWKKGGPVKLQSGGLTYENRMPRDNSSTIYTPPTGYDFPKVHPISTWFEDLLVGAIPYVGDAVDVMRGVNAVHEDDAPGAFVNFLGAGLPYVAGATLQNIYDAADNYSHDYWKNKPIVPKTKKEKGGPAPKKAAQMLKDNLAHGQPLTDAQKRYFQLLINQKNKK